MDTTLSHTADPSRSSSKTPMSTTTMARSKRRTKRASAVTTKVGADSTTSLITGVAAMTDTASDFTTTTILPSMSDYGPTPTAIGGLGSSPTSTPDLDLPEMPMWALHALAGLLSCLLVMAVMLLLAQFPPPLSYFSRFHLGSRTPGYIKIDGDDEYLHLAGLMSTPSRGIESSPHLRDKRLRKRRPIQLSVDTSVEYHGLGIAVPGACDVRDTASECDYSDLPGRKKPPGMKSATQFFTAPLPSAKVFGSGSHRHRAPPDIENSPATPASPSSSSSSSAFYDARAKMRSPGDAQTPGSALFEKINNGVCRVADKLSRTFYDHVTEPEDGLLLPVHRHEREKPLVHGVLVD